MANPDPCRNHARAAGGERPSRRDRHCRCGRRAGLRAGRCGDADLSALLAQADAGAAAGRIGRCRAFGLSDEEVALACASHSGEPMHTERVAAWLARIGCGENDLACGAHASRYEPVGEAMIRRGEKPTRLHNNCSGKHTGFLTVARQWDIATKAMSRPIIPCSRRSRPRLRELSGAKELPWGIDGCAAPNFAMSLTRICARRRPHGRAGQAREERAAASRAASRAMIAHPELVSGTGRACAMLMRALQRACCGQDRRRRVLCRHGFRSAGLGIAIKIDDGAGRASETAIAAVLGCARAFSMPDEPATRRSCVHRSSIRVAQQSASDGRPPRSPNCRFP